MKTKTGFYISPGNTKVHFVIVNVGAALDCPSRKWCPFDKDNHKSAGRNMCYAQKTELFRPNVLKSRRNNERIIRENPIGTSIDVSNRITRWMDKRSFTRDERTVRINESSDLSAWNIDFVVNLTMALKLNKIKVYLYSKAPKKLTDRAKRAGAVILHSERDFVAVKTAADSKLPLCPGICGAGECMRCPQGKQSAIIEH